MTPKELSGILDELQQLGLNDFVFGRTHHFRDRKPETIKGMQRYCSQTAEFEPDGNNDRLGSRLAFMLRAYREWKLPPGRTDVFMALATAACLAVPDVGG